MTDIVQRIESWAQQARQKLSKGLLTEGDVDQLLQEVRTEQPSNGRLRQRLLYLHALSPSIRSQLISSALHEPVKGSVTQIDPMAPELPYKCVHDAILDGWRVVQFPDQRAPFDDREIDILGYEFILEKMEVAHE